MEEHKKRKRERINKRWSSGEIRCILNYMENSTNVELPTAQVYYRKLITETGINAAWDLVKWKVRHLKNSFRKARDWRNSHEARLLESEEGTNSVEARVLQMCPAFHQLNNIFGEESKQASWHGFVDTGESIETAFLKIDADEANEGEESDIVTVDSNIFDKSSTSNIKNISWDKKSKHSEKKCFHQETNEYPDSTKKTDTFSLTSYLADFQAEKTSLSKMKFEWERQKHIEEMELNRKRLALEEEKLKAEIEYKKKELEIKEREIERKGELEKTVSEIGLKKHELELRAREIEQRIILEKEKTMADIEHKKNELELRAREIERDERLKVLEMEKDERIRKYEIDMKLKYESEHT